LTAIFVWSGGREARQGTANPSTRVQIPSRPPLLLKVLLHNDTISTAESKGNDDER
ncbi:MAG: hypothetical protein RJB59_757, partial [Actinomycetota bacterium]